MVKIIENGSTTTETTFLTLPQPLNITLTQKMRRSKTCKGNIRSHFFEKIFWNHLIRSMDDEILRALYLVLSACGLEAGTER